jgi:hypothetical protein
LINQSPQSDYHYQEVGVQSKKAFSRIQTAFEEAITIQIASREAGIQIAL